MKKILLLSIILSCLGCATLTYKTPDGTEVTYSRLFTTADKLEGRIDKTSAYIKTNGQKIDVQALKDVIAALLQTLQ